MTLSEFIMKHEGLERYPYFDTVGKETIGVGRNLSDNGISEDEALYLLANDLRRTQQELESFNFARYLNEPRWYALSSMLFNLGLSRFTAFRKMIAALEDKDWEKAADEALDSKWARQVGIRALEIADIIRTGKLNSTL